MTTTTPKPPFALITLVLPGPEAQIAAEALEAGMESDGVVRAGAFVEQARDHRGQAAPVGWVERCTAGKREAERHHRY